MSTTSCSRPTNRPSCERSGVGRTATRRWAGTNFAYQIPPGVDGISGLYIVWHVTDGGSPGAGNDTAGFSVFTDQTLATADCNGAAPPMNTYPVVDGNLVVH